MQIDHNASSLLAQLRSPCGGRNAEQRTTRAASLLCAQAAAAEVAAQWRPAPAGTLPGYCAVTGDRFPFAQHARWEDSWDECRRQCLSTPRCNFISVSIEGRACLWYEACDATDLRAARDTHYIATEAVRGWDARAPTTSAPSIHHLPAPSLRLALAGVSVAKEHDSDARRTRHDFGCAMVGWCAGARKIRHALPPEWSVTIALLSNASEPPDDCAEARMHPVPARLSALSSRCQATTKDPFPLGFLKFALVEWTMYDAVLFTDQDVDTVEHGDASAAQLASHFAHAAAPSTRRSSLWARRPRARR